MVAPIAPSGSDAQLVVLAVVAHVDGAGEPPVGRRDAFLLEPALGLRGESGECRRPARQRAVLRRQQPRHGEVGAQVGQQQAHGAEDAGIGRHQHAAHVELARQPRGVQRPRAAERHQRVVARIVAALHRDHADRPRHVGGDDREDALRGRPSGPSSKRSARPSSPPRPPASRRIVMRPPSRCSGFSVCSTTLASVTVGSRLPLP